MKGDSALTNKELTSPDKNEQSPQEEGDVSKKPWQPLKLTYTGEAKDVVQSGSGKLSPGVSDPGDLRKPPGQN